MNLSDLGMDLIFAARKGSIEVLEYLLSIEEVNVNFARQDGVTSLMTASYYGHQEAVMFLLNNGAYINSVANKGETAVFCASQNGHLEIVKFLLNKGANARLSMEDGASALTIAAQKGHLKIVEILYDLSDTNSKTDAILAASKHGNFEVVKFLLDRNVSLKQICNSLILSAGEGNLKVVELLLERGANINSTGINGDTPLIVAASNGHLELVKLLLHRGANIEVPQEDGCTPLIVAAYKGHLGVVKLLLENGADISPSSKNNTPLSYAIKNNRTEMVKALLSTYKNFYTNCEQALLISNNSEIKKIINDYINLPNLINKILRYSHDIKCIIKSNPTLPDEVLSNIAGFIHGSHFDDPYCYKPYEVLTSYFNNKSSDSIYTSEFKDRAVRMLKEKLLYKDYISIFRSIEPRYFPVIRKIIIISQIAANKKKTLSFRDF